MRDITGTVESIPLIASSIMSKKLASGANKIVLDVKYGSGAFMQDASQAQALAEAMVTIGRNLNRETVAVVSSMEQPLGYAVGNTLEVQEAIETLKGNGPADFEELCLVIASWMIYLGGKAKSTLEGRLLATELLKNGAALNKFYELVEAQGGSLAEGLPEATCSVHVYTPQAGVVQSIDAKMIGHASMLLGAGRETKQSIIDPTAGILLNKKIGDTVSENDVLATLYFNLEYEHRLLEVLEEVQCAYQIGDRETEPLPLILDVID